MRTEALPFVIDSGVTSFDAEQSSGLFRSIRQIVVPHVADASPWINS